MQYIKVGDRIFNPDQLCSASIDTDEDGVLICTIFFSGEDNSDSFYGDEATLVWTIISSLSATPSAGVAA